MYQIARFVFEKHDVVVYTKKQENSPIEWYVFVTITLYTDNKLLKLSTCNSFLGCGVVDAPMRTVSDFISDIQSAFSWDNTLMVSWLQKAISIKFVLISTGCKICESDT